MNDKGTAKVLNDVSNCQLAALDSKLHCSKPNSSSRPNSSRQPIVITSSGFRGSAKEDLKELLLQFDARYSGELVHGCTTHLVCKRLIDCFATPKYQRALEWGIHIVSYNWLLASAAEGQPVPEQDFKDDAFDALRPSPAPIRRQHQLQQEQHQLPTHDEQEHPAAAGALSTRCAQEPLQYQQPLHEPLQALQSPQNLHAGTLAPGHIQSLEQSSRHAAAAAPGDQQQQQQQQQQQHETAANQQTAGVGLFAFAAELPPNFLLLGSDSPRSSTSVEDSSPKFSLSQSMREQQQQQQPLLPPEQQQVVQQQVVQQLEQQQQPVLSPTQVCRLQADWQLLDATAGQDFQFCSRVGSVQQQASPCMQSFLPMQQQQPGMVSHDGSCSLQQQQYPLVGSELQPDGILDLQQAAQPQASTHSPVAAAAAPPPAAGAVVPAVPGTGSGPLAAAVVAAASETAAGAGVQLLIPETQFDDDAAVSGDGTGATGSCWVPCKTPDSLAHYASKQRRQQRARHTPAQIGCSADGRQQQKHQQEQPQHETRCDCTATDSAAAWPPSWLQKTANAAPAAEQQPGCCGSRAAATEIEQACITAGPEHSGGYMHANSSSGEQQHCQDSGTLQPHAAAAVHDKNTGGCSSSSKDIDCGPLAFVRIRRRDGYRRQVGRVLVSDATPPNPADLAELEDSNCEADTGSGTESDVLSSRDRSGDGDSECDRHLSRHDSWGGCDDNAAEEPQEPQEAGPCSRTGAARSRQGQQRQQQGEVDPLHGGVAAAGAALAAAFGHQRCRKQQPAAAAAVHNVQQLLPHNPAIHGQQPCHSPMHSCSGSSLPAGSCPSVSYSVGLGSAEAAAESGISRLSGSVQTGCSGQSGSLPVMRLNFSLGAGACSSCSSLLTPAGPTTGLGGDQQEQQQQAEEGHHQQQWQHSESAGCSWQEGAGCDEMDPSGAAGSAGNAAWSPGCNTGVSGESSSTCTTSTGTSRLSSGRSSKLQLRRPSSAAAEGGISATAAAMMQKRRALQQVQQQQQGGHLLVTPPSEGSLFVTRRKAPRPTGAPGTAAGSSTVLGGVAPHGAAQQPFALDTEPEGALLADQAATRAAGLSADGRAGSDKVGSAEQRGWSDSAMGGQLQQKEPWPDGADVTDLSDTDDEQDSHSCRPDAAAAGAEQLLQDLKHRQQQAEAAPCRLKAPKRQAPKQQPPAAAEVLLHDLRLQEQQRNQHSGAYERQVHGTGLAATGRAGHTSAAAVGDSNRAAAAAAVKPRLSVTSSCAGTELSTASHKVPLRLEGNGIVLHSCSASTSSTTVGDDGLQRALLKQLAATSHPTGKQQQPPQQHERVGVDQAEDNGGTATDGEQLATGHSSSVPDRSSLPLPLQGQSPQEGAMAGEGASWLHTPEDAQLQKQQQQQQQLDLIGLSTVGVDARGAAMSKHLGARLAQMSQAQEEVVPLRLLQKAPRGSTAKAHHGLKSNSKLVYADQVQVPWAHATFSTKERSRCVILSSSNNSSSSGSGGAAAFVGEPVAFYKLPSGEWYVEVLRFYSAKDLRELAKTSGQPVHLPQDFQLSYELLRGMQHEHMPLRQVQGEFKLSKVRKAPASNRSRAQSPFFWRYSVDLNSCQLLTDRPVTDFLVQ